MSDKILLNHLLKKATGANFTEEEFNNFKTQYIKLLKSFGITASGELSLKDTSISNKIKSMLSKNTPSVKTPLLKQDDSGLTSPIKDRMRDELSSTYESMLVKNTYNILIIDDDEDLASVNKDIITEKLKFPNCTICTNADDGLQAIKEGNYNLVLCDYRMPGLTGYHVYNEMSKLGNKECDFLILSGYSDSELEDLKKLGVQVFQKPTTPEKLAAIVKTYYIKTVKRRIDEVIK